MHQEQQQALPYGYSRWLGLEGHREALLSRAVAETSRALWISTFWEAGFTT